MSNNPNLTASTSYPLPSVGAFRATMKADNMPDDYPADPLAQLALDLRAAEAFIRTPEGAKALGFKLDRQTNQFPVEAILGGVTLEQRLALAQAIRQYREAYVPPPPPFEPPSPDDFSVFGQRGQASRPTR